MSIRRRLPRKRYRLDIPYKVRKRNTKREKRLISTLGDDIESTYYRVVLYPLRRYIIFLSYGTFFDKLLLK